MAPSNLYRPDIRAQQKATRKMAARGEKSSGSSKIVKKLVRKGYTIKNLKNLLYSRTNRK